MRIALVLAAVAAGSPPTPEGRWELKAREEGVFVYNRDRHGSDIRELKATAIIQAPPKAVWAVIRDYERYKDNMPYTEASRVLAREDGGRALHFHSVINAPLVSRRDYVIRVLDESDWKDGKGFLKASWTLSTQGPPPADDVVRVPHNEGYWLLEPRDGGKTTFATYWLFTDPGGAIPTFIANQANSIAIPDLFRALRKKAVEAPYRDAK